MFDLSTFRRMFDYSDWANQTILAVAAALPDSKLDEPLNIGPAPGSLRRILIHTYNGELVWLARWRGLEPKWPPELVRTPVADLAHAHAVVAAEREAFFATLDIAKLDRPATYRDSKGSLFRALLGDMILQGLNHSIHHRAQAANAIRRVGGEAPELDYMNRLRQPAE